MSNEGRIFKPFKVAIEVTYKCNLNCKFCYVNSELRENPDMPQGKLFKIIDEISKKDCLIISLLGGEPLIREDFLDIYKYIIKKGLLINILTNRTIINSSILDCFKTYPPYRMKIALYAADEKGYKKVTGGKGAFNAVMNFVKKLKKNNISFIFSSLISKLNINDFNNILDLSESFNVPLIYSLKVTHKINKDEEPYNYRLTEEDRKRICDLAKGRNAKLRDLANGSRTCKGTYLVDNFGRLNSCLIKRDDYWDLNKVSFKKAFRKSNKKCILCPAR